MKFDFCIGNPPYQDNTLGDNETYAPPVYNKFMDAAYSVAEKVELIHPARFLFNAGSTPREWNEKILNDEHFKVMDYEEDASKVFANTDIKGGIAITYHDASQKFGAIKVFAKHSELNSILNRIKTTASFESLSKIAVSSYAYHFTEKMHEENPDAASHMSKGHLYDLKSNIFTNLSEIFYDNVPDDGKEYLEIVGRVGSSRVNKYVRADYIAHISNTYKFKLFMPAANGAGKYGEQLATSIIAPPRMCSTETFLSVGVFETEDEPKAVEAYTKTKFFRALLGVKKTTQHLTPANFEYVPLQDFTPSSDIDWSVSIADIDKQLYKKYGLSDEEISFIETNVKEME